MDRHLKVGLFKNWSAASLNQRGEREIHPLLEIPTQSEALSADELHQITGSSRKREQIIWLELNGWVFVKNRAGEPIVGRLYARLRLTGLHPTALADQNSGPNFAMVK